METPRASFGVLNMFGVSRSSGTARPSGRNDSPAGCACVLPGEKIPVVSFAQTDRWERSWFLYSKDILGIKVLGRKKVGSRVKMYWLRDQDPKLFKV